MPTGVISRPSRPASSVTISIPRASKSHQTAIGRSFMGLGKFTTPSVVDPLPQTQSQVSVTSGRRQTYWNVSAFSTTSTPRTSRSICPMTWMPPGGSPIQRHPRMASATTGPTLQRSRPRTRMSCSIAESWSLADSPTRNSNAVRRSGLAAHLAEQIHGLSSPGMGKPQRPRLPALDVADGTRTTGLSSGMIARPEWSWPRRCTAWPLPRRSPRPILTPVQGPMTRPHAARGGEAPTHCVTGAAAGGPSPPAIRRAA